MQYLYSPPNVSTVSQQAYFLKVNFGQQTNIPITNAIGKSIAGTNMFAVKIAGIIIGQDQYSNKATMRELAI